MFYARILDSFTLRFYGIWVKKNHMQNISTHARCEDGNFRLSQRIFASLRVIRLSTKENNIYNAANYKLSQNMFEGRVRKFFSFKDQKLEIFFICGSFFSLNRNKTALNIVLLEILFKNWILEPVYKNNLDVSKPWIITCQ